MKKLNLSKLNDEMNSLNAQQMKQIKGGDDFMCYCGFAGGGGTPFPVSAPTLTDALYAVSMVCQGQGATCNGV